MPLLWTLFIVFTLLPISRCTEFFTHISTCCLCRELRQTVLLQQWLKTYCCGYPRWRSTQDQCTGTIYTHGSAWSSSTWPSSWEQGSGWRDTWVTMVLDRGVCPSEGCGLALWSGEHQEMLQVKITVKAQPWIWEETQGGGGCAWQELGKFAELNREVSPSLGFIQPCRGIAEPVPGTGTWNCAKTEWEKKNKNGKEEKEIQAEKLWGKNTRAKSPVCWK